MAKSSRAKRLRRPVSSSTLSECVDVSDDDLFACVPESEPLQPGDQHLRYSLEELVEVWGIHPLNDGQSCYNERLAKTALQHCCDQLDLKVHIDHNKEVDGVSLLPPLQTSSLQRANVHVYNQDKTKLLLQVEIHSSWQTVSKAIRGAADILRLLRNTDKGFDAITVFTFPTLSDPVCVGKITVKWDHLCFQYQIKWLTDVNEAWREIKTVIMEKYRAIPTLPSEDELDIDVPHLLSPQDLSHFRGRFGGAATQMKCPHHVMVECNNMVYKLFSAVEEQNTLMSLRLAKYAGDKQHTHFIVPEMTKGKPRLFFYPKVAYGPLTPETAGECMEELITKIDVALKELHSFGFSHGDVRLPNVCFDNDFNAVLIDMDRCDPV